MTSCVILTHNNENKIESLLASLAWCDEIIVVDDDSTDKTKIIAENRKAIVITHPLQNDFAAQRNIGLSKAKGDWILYVDSDETVTPELAEEIQAIVGGTDGATQGYFIKRTDRMWGRALRFGETRNIKLLRLARRGAGKWKREVHEIWDVKGETKTCTSPLLHSPHPDVKTFLSQINRYTTINAAVFYRQGKRANVPAIMLYPVAKFLHNYFIKLGFLDGTAGFVFAMMMSFHSFLTRAKLWQLDQKKEN